jgi:AraC-like DNA-binding protein
MIITPLTPEQFRRTLLTELRERIIPLVKYHGIGRLVLAKHPMLAEQVNSAPDRFSLSYHAGTPLEETQREHSQEYLYRWPEQYLHSMRSPRLCCVVQGEIDWRIGVTREAAALLPAEAARSNYHVLSMKAGSFLLIPPGTPYSDGRIPHWERTNSSQPESHVFWLQILPIGFFCHFCHSGDGEHTSDATIYVPDNIVKDQVRLLIEETQERGPNFESIAQSALLIILWRVERALTAQRYGDAYFAEALFTAEVAATYENDSAVQQACDFVQANLHQSLNLTLVAEHVLLSPSQLNRRFQAELGQSVMQFVRERRMNTAKSLLRDSRTPVQEIARMVGYHKPTQFARTFTQQENTSPSAYRKQARRQRIAKPPSPLSSQG